MWKVVLTRVLFAIPLVFIASLVMFLLVEVSPGGVAETILGTEATPERVAALNSQLGLDKPWYEQYLTWLSGAVHGDLGTSFYSGHPVVEILNAHLAVTISLVSLSLLVSSVLGVSMGLLSALRGGFIGRLLDMVSLTGMALPNFWVALILVTVFAVQFRWFPAIGYVPITESPSGWLNSVVLPVGALFLVSLAVLARQTRNAALEVLETDYIQVLRANGLPEWSVVLKHVLRNSAIPVVTMIGILSVSLLSGTVFIETVFSLPGLGSVAAQATRKGDVYLLLGVGVYFTLITVVINLVVDLLYGLLNPKVRTS